MIDCLITTNNDRLKNSELLNSFEKVSKPHAAEEETGKKLGNWIIDIYTGKKQLFGCRKRLFIYGQTNCNPSN